jgi:hypothetical protein
MLDLQEVLVSVWQQALIDCAKHIELDDHKYPVKTTAKRRLKIFAAWNKTPTQNRDGQKWLGRARR